MKITKTTKYSLAALGVSALTILPGFAQGSNLVNTKATEKANWHVAPREIQIIDDRPIVRDFREAPAQQQQIQLPPPPAGFSGGSNNGGGLAGGPGSSLPAGGMPLSGGNLPGYRSPVDPLGALPKSGFGRESNIPASLSRPRAGLQNGNTTGVVGNLLTPQKRSGQGVGPAKGIGPVAHRTQGNYTGPAVQTYSGGYGTGTGAGYGGSAGRSEAIVRGSLLRK